MLSLSPCCLVPFLPGRSGVYAWITVNYLLNNIGTHIPSSSSTYAVLDLGGASTQIVFEPTFSKDSLFVEGDHKYTLKFGGKTHTLYQHSYLGYGIMRARQSVHNLVYFMSQYGHSEGSSHKSGGGVEPVVGNPCISKTMSRSISLDGGGWTNPRNVSMAGEDVGSFEGCKRIVELVMAKDACVFYPYSKHYND